MVSDEFALEQFKKVYGHSFVSVELRRAAGGGTEIVGYYNKPHFKGDWIPHTFCRRHVHCVRLADNQPATPTPPVANSARA